MADIGLCKGCKKDHIGLTFRCSHCSDKFCTTCWNRANGGKCPSCSKVGTVKPNS